MGHLLFAFMQLHSFIFPRINHSYFFQTDIGNDWSSLICHSQTTSSFYNCLTKITLGPSCLMIIFRLPVLGSWSGQSSQGLVSQRVYFLPWWRVKEVEENSKEQLCPQGHKSSKMVWHGSWTCYSPISGS